MRYLMVFSFFIFGTLNYAWAAITLVQKASVSSNASPINLVFPISNAAGNTLLVVVGSYGQTTFSISDSRGNSYESLLHTSAASSSAQSWIVKSSIAGSNTVSVSAANGGSIRDVAIFEYSGLDPNPVDQKVASSNGGQSSITSDPVTTIQANELLFGYVWDQTNSATSATWTVTASGGGTPTRQIWTSNPDIETMAVGDMVVSSINTYTMTFTRPNYSNQLHVGLITLKAAVSTSSISQKKPVMF